MERGAPISFQAPIVIGGRERIACDVALSLACSLSPTTSPANLTPASLNSLVDNMQWPAQVVSTPVRQPSSEKARADPGALGPLSPALQSPFAARIPPELQLKVNGSVDALLRTPGTDMDVAWRTVAAMSRVSRIWRVRARLQPSLSARGNADIPRLSFLQDETYRLLCREIPHKQLGITLRTVLRTPALCSLVRDLSLDNDDDYFEDDDDNQKDGDSNDRFQNIERKCKAFLDNVHWFPNLEEFGRLYVPKQ